MKRFICWLLGHDYTCKANEGTNPTDEEIARGISGFWEYARMYCKRCGHVYKRRH